MRRPAILILITLTVGLLGLIPEGFSSQSFGRWDLRMIEEAPIWKRLLVNYTYSDQQRFWPQRKEALESVLRDFPDSRWADDAALLLACGRASLENDVDGAIAELRKIVERYPRGQTIVDRWEPKRGCRFDETWLMWQGALVFLNPDETIRVAKPFDRDGTISALEQEALTYFTHLEKYPRATSVMARLFIAEMQAYSGDHAGALLTLQQLVADADAYLPAVTRADRAAVLEVDGYHIRDLLNRPEYQANLLLIRYHEKQGQVHDAVEAAGNFVAKYSNDGWMWQYNRRIAELYDRHGFADRAAVQYRLSLEGLEAHKELVKVREKRVGGSELPNEYWELNRRQIEEKQKKR